MNVIDRAAMKVSKLSPHVGAEVTGIDLRRPVDEDIRRRLNEAVVEHAALVIRDQQFTPAEFLAALSLFGEPMKQDSPPYIPDVPLVKLLTNRDKKKDGRPVKTNSRWHTDHTNHEYPPKYTSLYAVELPTSGGGTSVANMRAGYNALPDDLKHRIDSMKTVNVRLGSAVKAENRYNLNSIEAQKLNPAPVLQPLVRTNSENGTKALYFHANKTENIVGMTPQATQDLLEDLMHQAVRDEFVYTHKWQMGDMLIWDNRSALHKANYDFDPDQFRTFYRGLVRGELPH